MGGRGGKGCTHTKTLHGPWGKGGHFLLIFKVIVSSNLERQSTLFWYVEMLKG